jgi:hypothetical protein
MEKLSLIAAKLGRKGGQSKSEMKRIAVIKNGYFGGRPRKNLNEAEADLADMIATIANDYIVNTTDKRIAEELIARLWKITDITNNVLRKHRRMEYYNIYNNNEHSCKLSDGIKKDFAKGIS